MQAHIVVVSALSCKHTTVFMTLFASVNPENEATSLSRLRSLNSRVKQLSFFNLLLHEEKKNEKLKEGWTRNMKEKKKKKLETIPQKSEFKIRRTSMIMSVFKKIIMA